MTSVLAKQAAEQEGYDDALMLDWRDNIAEATSANIFLVIDGALHTPQPDCFLNGITRQTIMELARKCSIQVIERKMTVEDLTKASEVFITGTAVEIMPVKEVGACHYRSGPVTSLLSKEYARLVRQGVIGP